MFCRTIPGHPLYTAALKAAINSPFPTDVVLTAADAVDEAAAELRLASAPQAPTHRLAVLAAQLRRAAPRLDAFCQPAASGAIAPSLLWEDLARWSRRCRDHLTAMHGGSPPIWLTAHLETEATHFNHMPVSPPVLAALLRQYGLTHLLTEWAAGVEADPFAATPVGLAMHRLLAAAQEHTDANHG